MSIIKKKPLTPHMIWDAKNNKPLCVFNRKGVLETDDSALIKKLKEMGHTVIEDDSKTAVESKEDNQDGGKETAPKPKRSRK